MFDRMRGRRRRWVQTTRTKTTRRIAAVMMKMPAPKRRKRLIFRQIVVLTGRMTGAGMAMMHTSVKMFMTRAGTRLTVACGLQISVVREMGQLRCARWHGLVKLTSLVWVDYPHSMVRPARAEQDHHDGKERHHHESHGRLDEFGNP